MAILEVKELSAGYGNGHVIQNISFSLERGDFLCVLGRNGSGKSTLIRAAQGLLKDRSGSVLVDGLDLSTMSPRDVARKIAYVPQLSYLPFEFCVEEVILMGRYIHQGKLSGITSTDRKVIEDIMDLTETTALRKKKIAHLSGGERQRVFIARALAQDTPLVFLDEPSAHLDINYQVEIYQILRRLQEEKATTVLVAEHNINLVVPYARRLLFLKSGKVHSQGPPEKLITRANIMDVFQAEVEVRERAPSGLPEISLTPPESRSR